MNFTALRSAQDNLRLAPGAHELGSLVWWELSNTRIDHPQLTAIAQRHGLEPKHLPAEIKPVQAFRRAWRHASSKLSEGYLLRPIAETSDEILVGLVREKPEHRDLDYDVVARIAFDKNDAKIRTDVEHVVGVHVRDLYRHHLAHTSEDVRALMTGFLAETGVSLRQHGAVYFVPAAHRGQLEALCRVVEEIGDNQVRLLPIIDTPSTRVTLREAAERTLDQEVRELEDELAAFDLDKVRETTLERRLEMFEKLRSRAGLFAGVLAFKADGLSTRVAAMENTIRQHLGVEPLPEPARATQRRSITPTVFAADVGF